MKNKSFYDALLKVIRAGTAIKNIFYVALFTVLLLLQMLAFSVNHLSFIVVSLGGLAKGLYSW